MNSFESFVGDSIENSLKKGIGQGVLVMGFAKMVGQ